MSSQHSSLSEPEGHEEVKASANFSKNSREVTLGCGEKGWLGMVLFERHAWSHRTKQNSTLTKNVLAQESQVGHILAEDHSGYFRNGESNPGLQGENLLS